MAARFPRVRTSRGCHAPTLDGRFRFYPPGAALPGEYDLGDGWTATRGPNRSRARWVFAHRSQPGVAWYARSLQHARERIDRREVAS
ncbi:hypothetical protein [Thalassobaculum sp.]|uniref:hypothetical protein n=1 Tax=Thalassobaculum sp. TaxID=2022740 RepID=UPI0032EB2C00